MTNALNRKEHFNLYYIFDEDKRNNVLDEKTADDIWKMVCARTKKEHNGPSPPPNS